MLFLQIVPYHVLYLYVLVMLSYGLSYDHVYVYTNFSDNIMSELTLVSTRQLTTILPLDASLLEAVTTMENFPQASLGTLPDTLQCVNSRSESNYVTQEDRPAEVNV